MESAERRPILVVEDDEAILRSIEQILADEGYGVVAASHGKEALELAQRTPPRLILLDMKMPVMDGWAFAAAYRRSHGPHAPIIVLTAAHDSRARRRGRRRRVYLQALRRTSCSTSCAATWHRFQFGLRSFASAERLI